MLLGEDSFPLPLPVAPTAISTARQVGSVRLVTGRLRVADACVTPSRLDDRDRADTEGSGLTRVAEYWILIRADGRSSAAGVLLAWRWSREVGAAAMGKRLLAGCVEAMAGSW